MHGLETKIDLKHVIIFCVCAYWTMYGFLKDNTEIFRFGMSVFQNAP